MWMFWRPQSISPCISPLKTKLSVMYLSVNILRDNEKKTLIKHPINSSRAKLLGGALRVSLLRCCRRDQSSLQISTVRTQLWVLNTENTHTHTCAPRYGGCSTRNPLTRLRTLNQTSLKRGTKIKATYTRAHARTHRAGCLWPPAATTETQCHGRECKDNIVVWAHVTVI